MLLRRCCPLWESRESLSIYWLTMWPLRGWRVLQTRSLRPQMSRFLQTWGPTSPSAAQRCTSTRQARQVRLDSVTDVLLYSVFDWGWFCTRQNGQKCPQNDKSVFNKWVKFMSRVPCRSFRRQQWLLSGGCGPWPSFLLFAVWSLTMWCTSAFPCITVLALLLDSVVLLKEVWIYYFFLFWFANPKCLFCYCACVALMDVDFA